MPDAFMHSIIRRVLAASLCAPVAFTAACGGRAIAGDGDSGTPPPDNDAEPPPDASFDAIVVSDGGHCDPTPVLLDAQMCDSYWSLPCGLPPDYNGTGYLSSADCQKVCGTNGPGGSCRVVTTTPEVTIDCMTCAIGRRPAGLGAAAATGARSTLGDYFARVAHLEAASVDAFRILREELAAHGAPSPLLRAVERAEADEVRHARTTSGLARRFGAEPAAPVVAPRPVRSLEEIALENAIEGCVRETFGALTATWQATAASDPAIAKAMKRIADDETQHASLAWEVARWIEPRLDAKARELVNEARRAAVRALRDEVRHEPPEELATLAGLPRGAHAERMVDAMETALWS